MSDFKLIKLKGELEDFGNHILMPYGITLCGLPTVDANKKDWPQLNHPNMADMINEYTEVEGDITCKTCVELIDMMKQHKESVKVKNN